MSSRLPALSMPLEREIKMSYLMFELQCEEQRREQYREFLRLNSQGVEKSSEYLRRALQLMNPQGECDYHSVVFSLARHVAEEVDAILILLHKGCVDPCKGHLPKCFGGRPWRTIHPGCGLGATGPSVSGEGSTR